MRIAITGATGFIGRRLVARLLRDGHAVVALSRDVTRARAVLPVRCDVAPWDPESAIGPATALDGADAIVHLAGAGVADERWTAARKRVIRQSRVRGTNALVATLAAMRPDARPRTLVGASAIGIYGDRGDEELDERSAPGAGFLAEVCIDWEAATRAAEALGVRTAVVRVGIVLGRDGGALRTMLPLFRLGLGGRLGSGRQWMSWIHVADVVELFVRAIVDETVTDVINAVAPQPIRNAEFTAALARALRRPAIAPAPAVALRLALGEMSAVVLASQRVLPRAALARGFAYAHPQLASALADLCRDFAVELAFEQWVPRPPSEVFAFFCEPRNLEQLTPDFLRFRVLGSSTATLQAGTRIDYRLSLHGIPVRWQSRIDVWEPPHRFVDVQTRGPYATWRHTHTFVPHHGGTVMRDEIRYEVPLGAVGDFIAGARVARDVQEIFAFRRRKVAELFG